MIYRTKRLDIPQLNTSKIKLRSEEIFDVDEIMITERSQALSRRSVSRNFAGSPEDLDDVPGGRHIT
jgi:hypothetical protein